MPTQAAPPPQGMTALRAAASLDGVADAVLDVTSAPSDVAARADTGVATVRCVTTSDGVAREVALCRPLTRAIRLVPFCATQIAPSGPASSWAGAAPLGRATSVTSPGVVTRAIAAVAVSLTKTAPSGPAVISVGWLAAEGSEKWVTTSWRYCA